MRIYKAKISILVIISLLIGVFSIFTFDINSTLAITAPAKIAYIEGKVYVMRLNAKRKIKAKVGMSIFYGDKVITRRRGRCQINMAASGILRLSQNTTVVFPLKDNTGDKISVVKMLQGKTWTNLKKLAKDEVFEVRASKLVAAIQGTKIVVTYDPRTGVATLGVAEGRVKAIFNKDIEKLLTTAKQISIDKKGRISAIINIDPKKLQKEFLDKSFKGADNNVQDIFLSLTTPADKSEFSKKNVSVKGTVSTGKVKKVSIIVKGLTANKNKKYRARVSKLGKFSKDVKLFKGENEIIVEARGKHGKSASKKVIVKRVIGSSLNISISKPDTGSEVSKENIRVVGTISDKDIKSVTLSLNGSEVRKISTKNGKFESNIKLIEGKNYISVTAIKDGQKVSGFSEVKYIVPVKKVNMTIISPVDNMSIYSDNIDYMGRVDDIKITQGICSINGKKVKFSIKEGQFRGNFKLNSGKNSLIFMVKSSTGQVSSVERRVIVETASEDSISIFTPTPGITYKNSEQRLTGRIGISSVNSVDISINDKKVATLSVSGNSFSGKLKLVNGKNKITVSFKIGKKVISKSIIVEMAKESGALPVNVDQATEIAPKTNIFVVENGGSRGSIVISGNVIATPPVKYVNVYVDSKLYNKVAIKSGIFRARITLTKVAKQIRIVPIWKDNHEYTRATAVWSDKESPKIDISIPIANTRYPVQTPIDIAPNIIKLLGIVNDKTLKDISYKVNLNTLRYITYSGNEVVNFSTPVSLFEGQNTIYILATDYFGNQAQKSVIVYFEPLKTGTVTSGIVDKYTHQPITGALVQLVPVSGQKIDGSLKAVSNSEGKWTITNVPEGRYIVIVARDNYLPAQKEIYVKGGTVTNTPPTNQSPIKFRH